MVNVEVDKLVVEIFKKRGYEKVLESCSSFRQYFCEAGLNENGVEQFYGYLRKKIPKLRLQENISLDNAGDPGTNDQERKTNGDEKEEATRVPKTVPKLSFEVAFNFDKTKVSNKTSVESKKQVKVSEDRKVNPKKVPENFLKHILALGFQKDEAPLLYENKDRWVGVELDTKIKCTEQGCKFATEMHSNCLVNHCKVVHGWRDYPCEYKSCNWVSHSSTNYKKHVCFFHEGRSSTHFPWKCDFVGCEASFDSKSKLQIHLDVHNNIGYECSFCSYKNSKKTSFITHLDHHFGNKSYNCDFCSMSFLRKGDLTQHIENFHEAVQYKCPLCDQTGNIHSIRDHICRKHKVKYTFDRKKNQFIIFE